MTKSLIRIIVIMLVCLLPVSAAAEQAVTHKTAKGTEDQKEYVDKKIANVENELSLINYEIDQLRQTQEMSNDVIANGLNTSNLLISVFAALFAVGAFLIGIYVTRICKKVETLDNEVTIKETAVRTLSQEIHENFDNLFSKIRRADTKSLLERLVSVPQDIANIAKILLTRELVEDDYPILRGAYEKLLKSGDAKMNSDAFGNTIEDEYAVLFLQHFPAYSFNDPPLRKIIMPIFEVWIANSAFPNDIEKVAREISPLLKDSSLEIDHSQLLLLFRRGLVHSRYHNNKVFIESVKALIDNDSMWEAAGKEIKG